MASFKDVFIQAIHDKMKVRITFFSKEDGKDITRLCAPMDYGPGRKMHDQSDRYWLWDYNSDTGVHPLPLKEEQIRSMVVLEDSFDPDEFIRTFSSAPSWIIPRDW